MITRRALLAGALATAGTWVAAATAQADRVRRLGVLALTGESDPVGRHNADALIGGLSALSWREGVNLRIDWRSAGGDSALFERYGAELVALHPEVLLAVGSPAIIALRRQAGAVPIVFTIVTDPVGQGFVKSLARPGANMTGFTDFDAPMAGKWLGLLTQLSPPATRLAVLFNPATAPFAPLMMRAIAEAAPSLAATARAAPVADAAEIAAVVAEAARQPQGGLLVLPDAFTMANRSAIIAAAARARLPAVYWHRIFAADGGLMSYGTDNADLYRRSAAYIDRILKGAKPADLPVQNPSKFELTINLKTAKAMGLAVPPALLAAADKVIE